MKQEFLTYLNEINTTQTVQDRVATFYNLCRDICTEELVDIFVDDYVNQDGSISYPGLSFFSEKFDFSIVNFLTEDKILVHGPIFQADRFSIQVKDYDFKKGNDQSRMSIELSKGINDVGYYKASKNNCDFLLKIIKKYLLQRL